MSNVRSRQQKRRDSRTPAVWRGQATPPSPEPRERPEHGIRDELRFSWRLLSGGIVASLLMVMVVFFMTDLFYVTSIRLEGAEYLNESEVFRYAEIAEQHIFWVNPDTVRQNVIQATPLVANARVQIGWPPNMVTITVQERRPTLLWTQAGIRTLIDVQGNILRSPRDEEDFPELVQIIADNSFTQPRLPNEPIPIDVVSGALQLQRTFSGLPSLRYNANNGLGFREPNTTWDVWLGTGTNMPNKLRVYEALRDNLLIRGVPFVEINVADLNSIYYFCESIESCYE
jgi:hypothetical protein